MDHEYAILGGINRSKVGRYIYVAASAISAAIVFVILAVVDVAARWDLNVNVPPGILALAGAATVYLALYAFFDNVAWKFRFVQRILKLPDLSGTWSCTGQTLENTPSIDWSAEVTIVQSWDKIRLRMETTQSYSDSQAAALQFDSAVGYRLLYHYKNTPKIGERTLAAHHGFAELIFSPCLTSARGEYFNGRGRNTFGSLNLTKEVR